MPLQPNSRAPYTSASAATTALDAFRDRGLGTPVDAEVLVRAGVSETIARRTVKSLEELELLSEDGQPTETFEQFKTIRSDDEYRAALQRWLRDLYADVLQYCDPSVDDAGKVQDAFRGYHPEGQRSAMASLLIGLWEYAGLPLPSERSAPPPSASRTSRTSPSRRRSSSKDSASTSPDVPAATAAPSTPPDPRGLLFGVTDSDIAALTDSEFDEVWSALGKVARARSRKNDSDSQVSQVSEEDGP